MSVQLNEDNEHQVQAFLRFAKTKRDENVREVRLAFDDVKDYKLEENIYTKDDVKQLLDDATEEISGVCEKEMENNSHQTGLLLKLLYAQAEAGGLDLFIDTNKLEDELLLKTVKTSEREALAKPAAEFARRPAKMTLSKMSEAPKSDPKLLAERDALKAEVEKLRERFVKLQDQSVSAMREKRELASQVGDLSSQLGGKSEIENELGAQREKEALLREEQERLASTLSAQGQSQNDLMAKLAEARAEAAGHKRSLDTVKLELEKASKDAAAKMSESKQFQTMKAMMQKKSKELVLLKKKLAKYEPDNNIRSADQEDEEFDVM